MNQSRGERDGRLGRLDWYVRGPCRLMERVTTKREEGERERGTLAE